MLGLLQGDITKVQADAIVNAANSRLMGGGGVDGAIHDAAGTSVMDECARIGSCPTGKAVATKAGRLRARWIFHAVGPEWDDGNQGEADVLGATYQACLTLADEKGCETIAFPAISTGTYAFPLGPAAEVALDTVARHLEKGVTSVKTAVFVLYDHRAFDTFARVLSRLATERQWPVGDWDTP
ncbi:MAG: macro domain-containing protein [Candidatus Riflebacteria bacterium]|nr:macro domain-containing protein [Candidatus Riflebacteria bacterium]